MTHYRSRLPQLDGDLFMTDGGIETTLIFHDGCDLPYFAAFHLLKDEDGTEALRKYFTPYVSMAGSHDVGFILESPTWRASADWARKLGYSSETLAEMNRRSIALMEELRDRHGTGRAPMVISGCVGPRGDGYDPSFVMTPDEAQAYHAEQIDVFATTAADMITAITMTNVNEGIGVTCAARDAGMPVAISFTVETDGRLPTGQPLGDAIAAVDAATEGYPAYFMINCAHPTHFESTLSAGGRWVERLGGIRANASRLSHKELDEATTLDDGDPVEMGHQYATLRRNFGHINVFGGCCGTDHRHIGHVLTACTSMEAALAR